MRETNAKQSSHSGRDIAEQGSHDYDHQKWVELYNAALLELERAKMLGRIGDARTAIEARLKELHAMPYLHGEGSAMQLEMPLAFSDRWNESNKPKKPTSAGSQKKH